MGFDLNEYIVQGEVEDISTAGSTFLTVPFGGNVKTIYTTLNGAIATADATMTFEVGGVAMTNSAITVATVASAAGDADSSSPSALNRVEDGGAIEVITSGASTNAVKLNIAIVIER